MERKSINVWTRLGYGNVHMKIPRNKMIINELPYHNMEHLDAMYQWLADNNVPYNAELDWAILYHDAVYDNQPNKELRSAQLWADVTEAHGDPEGVDPIIVYELIMATKDHVPFTHLESLIVRADLHALTDPVATLNNFYSLLVEGMILYKVNEFQVLKGMRDFLIPLYNRIEENQRVRDPKHAEFYYNVNQGISQSMSMCNAFLARYNPDTGVQRRDVH